MSRSYRKMPILKDGGRSKKIGKKFANQKVRITKDLISHGYYKKVYSNYNIWDYCSYWTLEDMKRYYKRHHEDAIRARGYDDYFNLTEKEIESEWKKDYYWK